MTHLSADDMENFASDNDESVVNMSDTMNDKDDMQPMNDSTPPSYVCWMCEYNTDPEARKLAQFISDQAPYMGTTQLSQIVHQRLQEVDPEGVGHSFADIKEHIQSHTLAPSVRISGMMRCMTMLMDRLEGAVLTTGDDDTTIVDAKNVAIYLKIANEVMQLYKTGECSKLLFSEGGVNAEKLAGPVVTANASTNTSKKSKT